MLVSVTRTVRLRIAEGVDPRVIPAIESMQAEWHKAVGFYTGLFLEHPDVYDEKKIVTTRTGDKREVSWTAKDRLTWAERMSVRTEDHPLVLRDFGEVCPQMPVTRRRAAINAASGAVASYLANHKQWEKADPETRGKEPKPPDPHPHLTLYGGMYDLSEARLRQGSCRLKVFSNGRWRWRDVPVLLPPYALDLLAQSEREQARIAAERAEQNARMIAEKRARRTREEKKRLRATPGVWIAQSPTLIAPSDGLYLHVPFVQRVELAGRAEKRRLTEPTLKVGTIDLNADSTVAAAWEGERCRGVKIVWHAQENAKRERELRKIARKQQASGPPVKGERANRMLWTYIRHLDDSLAWYIAAQIVAWAVARGLQILVFEYLRPYRPERGLSWSRRTNRKRSYWLRGKILRHTRDLALYHGILVVERNPAWTSQACPRCHRLGERFSPSGTGYPSRWHCGHCGWSGDANVAAVLNLKLKWDRTFRDPTTAERPAAAPRRARKGSATANSETVPTAV
jgi:transposase